MGKRIHSSSSQTIRTSVRRFLCWDSHQFTVLINDPKVSDPTSYQGRKFRRIFRVPFIIFKDYIMKEIIEKQFWTIKQPSGHVPIEMRSLMKS